MPRSLRAVRPERLRYTHQAPTVGRSESHNPARCRCHLSSSALPLPVTWACFTPSACTRDLVSRYRLCDPHSWLHQPSLPQGIQRVTTSLGLRDAARLSYKPDLLVCIFTAPEHRTLQGGHSRHPHVTARVVPGSHPAWRILSCHPDLIPPEPPAAHMSNISSHSEKPEQAPQRPWAVLCPHGAHSDTRTRTNSRTVRNLTIG